MDFDQGVNYTPGPKTSVLPNAIFQDVHENWTALHEAAASGDNKKLQMLLNMDSDRAVKESQHGNTALHEAASKGYSRSVKILCKPRVNEGQPKNKKSKNLNTKSILVTTVLNIQNNDGCTALHLAAQNGHNQSCRELLLAGADPNIKNNYGDTPLHTSCRYGHAGATRILISADCDPNIVNLNGDHPLHISCAMGRRKLTRLLLEADCDMNIKNAQGETPRDIAIRKNYSEILDILNNPQRMRNRHEKNKQQSHKISLNDSTHINGISWSPYGCHYFPDPRSFPAPKLETLPKEPLKRGEQYYLDLAGHIRKGPIGVGNTCYCGPFFKHIEHKINCNRKSLRMYVNKTKENLDNKVRALAMRTNDQIEQLTRSVIADRVRCESRRLQLSRLLKRGEPLRSTTDYQQFLLRRQGNAPKTSLMRSRSMEIFDRDSAASSAISNSRSWGGLLDESFVMPPHSFRMCGNSEDEESPACEKIDDQLSTDFLNQTHLSEILEDTKNLEQKLKTTRRIMSGSPDIKPDISDHERIITKSLQVVNVNHIMQKLQNVDDNGQRLKYFDDVTQRLQNVDDKAQRLQGIPSSSATLQNRYENIDNVLVNNNQTGAINTCDPFSSKYKSDRFVTFSIEDPKVLPSIEIEEEKLTHSKENCGNKFFNNFKRNEYSLQSVISALRKQRSPIHNQNESSKTTNESTTLDKEKISYKDEITFLTKNGNIARHEDIDVDHKLNSKEPDELIFKSCIYPTQEVESKIHLTVPNDPRVSSSIEKIEIRNSEIKLLKKPMDIDTCAKKNRVQELVARLQGKLSATHLLTQSKHKQQTTERRPSFSESSEDEQNNHNEFRITKQNFIAPTQSNPNVNDSISNGYSSTIIPRGIEAISDEFIFKTKPSSDHLSSNFQARIIPKDAYFHQLPNKKRSAISPRDHNTASNTTLYNDYTNQNSQDLETSSIFDNNTIQSQNFDTTFVNYHNQNRSLTRVLHNCSLDNQFPSSSVINTSTIRGDCESMVHSQRAAISRIGYKTSQPILYPSDNYVHYVERDISNDSGVSTHFNGGIQGLSPSLSPQTYYPSEHHPSTKNFSYSNYMAFPLPNSQLLYRESGLAAADSTADFTIGNVSSLV